MTSGTRASRALAEHFFRSFFRLTFLDDAGEESFKRAIIGVLAATAAAGLFIARLYVTKYAQLPARYPLDAVVAADRLFAIALPMFVTAVVMTLASRAVFPDERDFRILMTLPLARHTVFLAKLAALVRFVLLFVGVTVGTVTLPLSIIVSGQVTRESSIASVVWLCASAAAGCLFSMSAIASVQGIAALVLPAHLRSRASMWTQTLLVGCLILALPLVLRSSSAWRSLAAQERWLLAVPPAWFLGLTEWLLGGHSSYAGDLAARAVAGVVAASACAGWCAIVAYRRFDQSILGTGAIPSPRGARRGTLRLIARQPATLAISEFISCTLRRSGLHQFVFVAAIAAGAALAINSLVSTQGLRERWMAQAVLGTPFTIMAASVLGLRTALLFPSSLRSGWLFRMTETAESRPREMNAVFHALFTAGAIWPAAMTLPLLAAHFGVGVALRLAPIVIALGWTFAEAACVGWRRVPFTCTLLFAKRPPAYTIGLLVFVFGWFVFVGASLLNAARAGALPWLIVALLVATAGLAIHYLRRQQWGAWPLEFEDYLPDGFDALRLQD